MSHARTAKSMEHALAVTLMVAKNRASHRSNQPLHAMRVLAVAAALPIVAACQLQCAKHVARADHCGVRAVQVRPREGVDRYTKHPLPPLAV